MKEVSRDGWISGGRNASKTVRGASKILGSSDVFVPHHVLRSSHLVSLRRLESHYSLRSNRSRLYLTIVILRIGGLLGPRSYCSDSDTHPT